MAQICILILASTKKNEIKYVKNGQFFNFGVLQAGFHR